jgi:4-amino-4-deoxy-L-arabinose transferase-like glycosyltransferase
MLNKENWISRNLVLFTLLFLFLIAGFLRMYLLDQNLFFGPEQGIDFLVVKDLVVNHKATLIGAKTDISGIFHGPIYYYLSAIPFFLSQGNPFFVAAFLAVINCLTVFFIYLLGKELFNKRVGLISSLLFAFSFTAIVYSRWLSTHPIAIPLVCLYFLFFVKFLKGSKRSLLGASIALGLLAQTEFLNILFFSVITLVLLIIYYKNFVKENKYYLLLCAGVALSLSIGSFVLFDLRHNFLIVNNILSLVQGDTGYHISFIDSVSSSLLSLFNLVTGVVVPFYLPLAIAIFSLAVLFLFKDKKNNYKSLLLVWLFIPPILLIILHHEILDQFFVALIPAVFLIIAFFIDRVWKKTGVGGTILLLVFVCLNLIAWSFNIPRNDKIFFQSTQLDLKYSDEVKVIDEIYERAEGRPFSIQAYTIPYWSQQGWKYLFWYYGKNKYGYLPIEEKAGTLFVIIQTDPRNERYQKDWLRNTVSKWGKSKSSFTFGSLTVKQLDVDERKF